MEIKKYDLLIPLTAVLVGALGLIGVLLCGGSVMAWTLALGSPRNYVGAILVLVLCCCAFLCCLYVFWFSFCIYYDNWSRHQDMKRSANKAG
jgi:protein-S-isoprenylcysteine O-methyltransferase Ste14